jgi:DNA-binding beta-propeller fold protein YncE
VPDYDRRRARRQDLRHRRRRLLVFATLACLLAFAGWALLRGGKPVRPLLLSVPAQTAAAPSHKPAPRHRSAPVDLVARRARPLAAALQDAAAAPAGRATVLLAGGLTATDTSSDAIRVVGAGGERLLGRLPRALHDAAAVSIGGAVYVFGGGTATSQLNQILRIDRSGKTTQVGHLPAPSSDQAAAAAGGTAYVVGGFTGSRWLDTIVAWRPGSPGRHIVAHLPTPVRYAAVAAVNRRLVIAGGSLPSGKASDAVLTFDPSSGRVHRIATLPRPVTHAAAVDLGGTVFVVGGRGTGLANPTSEVVSVDATTGRVRLAGRLPAPLSDLAAVSLRGGVLVAGGHGRTGAVATLTELTRRTASSSAAPQRARAGSATNVYAADRASHLTGAARFARPLVYVPNSQSNTVDVIDQRTFRIVRHFAVGRLPQHVIPSYDLKTLYIANDAGNSLTTIDPRTGRSGRTMPVDDPYNMYFTPDGRYAIVVAERLARLDFRNAHSFRLRRSLAVPCRGVDHIDFSADGSYLLASCEFSGQLVKVDVRRERVLGTLALRSGAAPQDVKLSPDGRIFYVADLTAGGVWQVDGDRLRVTGFVPTGLGTHGLYVSRDARFLYVTNRGEGSISVISFRTGKVVHTWRLPGGGSPDMGGVSADGKVLWLSGRYDAQVYAISTRNGRVIARIPVGLGPHGLSVWPQPGRYSLGHTGILR